METASPPSPCVATLLEVIFVTSIMNNCVDVLEVDPYTQSVMMTNTTNTTSSGTGLEDDILVVLICACVKHANQMIVCFLQ